jgi:Holliday junction resolvasome RuvABC endonuclease subunit
VRVLFLDLATTSGYAVGSLKGVEAFGAFALDRTYENIGRFLNEADRKIEELFDRFMPGKIAFESPFINRKIDTIIKIRKLSGLANVAEQVAERHELECQEASTDEICRNLLGKSYPRRRKEKKLATRVKIRDLGFNVSTDDEADAVAGLIYMLSLEDPARALELTPLFANEGQNAGQATAPPG